MKRDIGFLGLLLVVLLLFLSGCEQLVGEARRISGVDKLDKEIKPINTEKPDKEVSVEQIFGCMNSEACNYNPDATVDDGSCTYPISEYYDCDGFCIPLFHLPWREGGSGNWILPCITDSNPACDECYGVGPYIELSFSTSTICVSQSGECVVAATCGGGSGNCPNGPLQNNLNLLGKDLGGPIPDNIGQLNYLEILGLANNGLTGKIPKTIGALTNLAILTLNNNFLEGNIPEQICNLQGEIYFPGWCSDDYCQGWEELFVGFPMYDFRNNTLCPPWPPCIEYFPVGSALIAGQDISDCPELEEDDCYRCDSSSSQEACAEWGGSYGCHYCIPGDDNYHCNENNINQCICMSSAYGCCYIPPEYQAGPSGTGDIFQYLEQQMDKR